MKSHKNFIFLTNLYLIIFLFGSCSLDHEKSSFTDLTIDSSNSQDSFQNHNPANPAENNNQNSHVLEGEIERTNGPFRPSEDFSESAEATQEEIGRAFSNLNIPQEKLIVLARGIFKVMDAVTEKYLIADNISLTVFVLRYLAEIGEYEIVFNEIKSSLEGFLKLAETELSKEVWNSVQQIEKLRFGKKKNKYFVQLFTKNKESLFYNINEPLGDDILKSLEIQNKTTIYFEDINTEKEKESLVRFIKRKVTPLFFLPGKWFKKLNQVHSGIPKNIESYIAQEDLGLIPLKVTARRTKIHLKSRSIKLKRLYAMPSFKDRNDKPLPSVIIKGKTSLLPLKISIDR